ncbi:MAG: hypothetical protein IJA36_05350 [Lachnospiraceae bacterium]|nr:hypothetical protein [Lachnospiraceae bacterium]
MFHFFATFFIVMIFIVGYALQRNHATREYEKKSHDFWERESLANSTRKKTLDGLELITIPLESLPFSDSEDNTLKECEDIIRTLATQDIINLTGISNTDLKLTYGAPNFPYLSRCDQNFTDLVRTLNQWAKRLLELNQTDHAQTILEFAIDCKSDVSTTYQMLSAIYSEKHQGEKIQNLIKTAETLNTLLKNKILKDLERAYISSGFADLLD